LEVRKRLSVTGEWPAGEATDNMEYDEALVAAVKHFQRRHGLVADGLIGGATLAAMNTPADRRVRQIILNMESWRWVSRHPGDWFLVVNIPSFDLTAVRHDKVDLTMPVIVGQAYNMTPVFSDNVRYVVFNPYWDVPLSIAQKEMLPKVQKDPSYFKKENIRLYDGTIDDTNEVDSAAVNWAQVKPEDMGRYRLRQDSGPSNSLGTVGFIFPNSFNVYLHDTPAYALFEHPKRAFSHGCIRVSKAQELAAYILGGPDKGWTAERVRAIIAEGKNQIVHLESSLPIYILYNTAVIDLESHEILFYEDVYGRDVLLDKALF
jgi:murein L,D-transpeptidase YcbB/YkuD